MLICKDDVIKAMNLSTGDVVRALERSGYKQIKISYVDFKGMNTYGSFVYDTEYFDLHTGERESGKVYVSFDNFGKMVADF